MMGMFYDLNCPTCDYSIFVKRWIGSRHYTKRVLLSHIESAQNKGKAIELWANGAKLGEDAYDYGYELYACPKCMRLANEFYLKLVSPTEQFKPDYRCSDCKSSLRRVEKKHVDDDSVELVYRNHHKVNWKCPKCSGDKLIVSRWGLWD